MGAFEHNIEKRNKLMKELVQAGWEARMLADSSEEENLSGRVQILEKQIKELRCELKSVKSELSQILDVIKNLKGRLRDSESRQTPERYQNVKDCLEYDPLCVIKKVGTLESKQEKESK